MRTHQHIDFARLELRNNLLVGVFGSCGVQVHPQNPGRRKQNLQLIFQFFGAKPNGFHLCGAAGGAGTRHFLLVAAIVTPEFARLHVVGQAYGAVGAFGGPIAVFALNIRRVAASVLKQNALLFVLQIVAESSKQGR